MDFFRKFFLPYEVSKSGNKISNFRDFTLFYYTVYSYLAISPEQPDQNSSLNPTNGK